MHVVLVTCFLISQNLVLCFMWLTPNVIFVFDVVMTDGVIKQMNITNASCVIHFNFPGSKTQCGNRLTTLAGTFTSSEVTYCQVLQLYQIVRLCARDFYRMIVDEDAALVNYHA